MMDAGRIELDRFRNSPDSKSLYEQGVMALLRSGILGLLRQFARPFSPDNGANPYIAARSAAYAEGYNQALDDLIYFDQRYLAESLKAKNVRPDFGGLALAVKKGDLTEEEAYGKSTKSRK
jgi:hypothetical protein